MRAPPPGWGFHAICQRASLVLAGQVIETLRHSPAQREYDTSNEELRKERQIDEFKYRLTLDDLADMMVGLIVTGLT